MSLFSRFFSHTHPLNLDGFCDWHCHILPGVDDGVRTMDEALGILSDYEDAGIKEVWLTPHIMEDVPNTTEKLRERFRELSENYKGGVTLHLAAENMLDNLFKERLEADDVLPIGREGNMLLVETSYFNSPMKFSETIEAIKAKGYFPLLAHPERYSYINTMSTYRKLKEQGVLFQLNLMSLCGHYGPAAKEKAHKLLMEGMYDRYGSDLHRSQHLDVIRTMKLPQSRLDIINKPEINL